eukprot:1316708-Amphidinium_carterae.1
MPLAELERFVLEHGFPSYALSVALNVSSGSVASLSKVRSAKLCGTLRSAGRQVEVRKYEDDMVLVAAGPYFAHL